MSNFSLWAWALCSLCVPQNCTQPRLDCCSAGWESCNKTNKQKTLSCTNPISTSVFWHDTKVQDGSSHHWRLTALSFPLRYPAIRATGCRGVLSLLGWSVTRDVTKRPKNKTKFAKNSLPTFLWALLVWQKCIKIHMTVHPKHIYWVFSRCDIN